MQFKDLLENLFNLFCAKPGGAFLLEAAIVCVLVQLCKTTLINKLKIDFTKSFDPTVWLPFVFGVVCAAFKSFVIAKTALCWDSVYAVAVQGLAIGASSTIVYRIVSTFDRSNIKTLCKDGFFNILYNEILIVSDIKQKLLDKEITMKEFVQKLSAAANGIRAVYCEDIDDIESVVASIEGQDTPLAGSEAIEAEEAKATEDKKRQCLKTLLSGFVSDASLEQVSEVLHAAFEKYCSQK